VDVAPAASRLRKKTARRQFQCGTDRGDRIAHGYVPRRKAIAIENTQPGEIITFGRYPQTVGGTDSTPIQWLVLENSGDELFVLSRYILDCRRYHCEFTDTCWQECDLRQWLNDAFYHSAFTDAEKKIVTMTHNTDHGEGSPDTVDRVFLLSAAEVHGLIGRLGKDFVRARGTEFAKVKKPDGWRLYVMDKNIPADYIFEGDRKYGCSWWWLRDQGRLKDKGNNPSRAVFIGQRASIRHYARVDQTGDGVRPAVRLHISKAYAV
jgi:hypothetical protein